MPVQYLISEAAHKYGLDNMAVNASSALANQKIFGGPSGSIQTWQGDYPPAGKPAALIYSFANGFTQVVNMTGVGNTTAVVIGNAFFRTDTGEAVVAGTMNQFIDLLNPGFTFGNDSLFAGDDSITGNAFNNTLNGFGGNDRIDGGAGTDTAFYPNPKSQYQVTKTGNTMTVAGLDGTDTLVNIERLQFGDKNFAYDINGIGGKVYRLYQAAFDRKPDLGGLGVWMNQMDNGKSLEWVSTQFQQSEEFHLRYGLNVLTDQFVTLLYQNVLHRAPEAGGFAAWTLALNANAQTREQVLAGFSESEENQTALIGLIQNGFEYTLAV